MVSCSLTCLYSNLAERVKIAMGVFVKFFPGEGATSSYYSESKHFSRGEGNVIILLIFLRLLTLQYKYTFTKRFAVSTPQRKCTMKALWKNPLVVPPWKNLSDAHELHTTESEKDLNYQQLRLRFSH